MKTFAKYVFILGLLLIIIGALALNQDVFKRIYIDITYKDETFTIKDKNEYYRKYDFNYVQNKEILVAKNKQDILNIYYTGLNSGNEVFDFKCSTKYKNCIKDVRKLANNKIELSDINNFVHPFNTFKKINTSFNKLGIVQVKIKHAYTEEEINAVNSKIEMLYPTLTNGYNANNEQSVKNTIRTIHDYIINTTKYDSKRADNQIVNYKSEIAYGPLYEGYALCGGYTDLMELFLERMNIEGYRITANKHIWNGVNINGTWYNLDLTWDDPVANTGEAILSHNYFLIDTNKMLSQDTTQHAFNQDVFSELKST